MVNVCTSARTIGMEWYSEKLQLGGYFIVLTIEMNQGLKNATYYEHTASYTAGIVLEMTNK